MSGYLCFSNNLKTYKTTQSFPIKGNSFQRKHELSYPFHFRVVLLQSCLNLLYGTTKQLSKILWAQQHFGSFLSQVKFWSLIQLTSKTVGGFASGIKYSRIDQVKFVKDSL